MEITDIHAHILPGVDDGARDWEEALAMAQMSYDQGFRSIIATPHHSRRNSRAGLKALADELQVRVRRQMPEMRIWMGEELFYYEGLAGELREGKALTLGGSRYALVEFDPGIPWGALYQAVRKLNQARYVPVIAHVERYASLRKRENLGELMKCDCRFQMNYSSLEGGGLLSRDIRWCRRQVQEGKIHYLGTDMHRMDHRRPDIQGSLRWLRRHAGEETLSALMYGNAEKIVTQRKAGE